MIKLKLYPPSGTIEDARVLKFEISGIGVSPIRVSMENATHGTKAIVTSLQDMGDGTYMGIANIKIPAHLTHSMISIFAHIEEKQEDSSYKTIQICPTIFTVINETEGISEPLSVYPSFIGPEDLCSIRVFGEPNSKKVISVNDKFFKTIIKSDGFGSVSFKGKDVIGQNDIDTVYQLPIYLYDEKDNFTKKVFSDSYLNVLPSSIAMHAEIDPRCDPTSDDYVDPPGSWAMPDGCIDDVDSPIIDPLEPTIPPNALPTTCKEGTAIISNNKVCKIFDHSATLLNNGMVVHAYLSPDITITDSEADGFNINKVFLADNETTLDVLVITNRDVVVEPKASGQNFTIHVQEDVWMAMAEAEDTSANDIYVILFDSSIGFQRIQIIDRSLDEYTGSYILTGEMENDTLVIRDWIFCVNAVFYHAGESPDTNLDINSSYSTGGGNGFVVDSDGNILQAINVSIASNSKHSDTRPSSYVYLIVEAIKDGNSQLFFTSAMVGKNDPYLTTEYIQLTTNGNNQNPVAKIGSDNNLHVVWESDRSGLKQIYYGVIGMSVVSSACTAFSACIDKYSEFLSRTETPFDYLSVNLLTRISGDVYNPSYQLPEYSSDSLINSIEWDTYGYTGTIIQSNRDSYINDLTIIANALTEDALAFNSFQIVDSIDNPSGENPSDTDSIPYSQFNYQVAFNLTATVTQDSRLAFAYDGIIIDDKEMDNIFDEWKSEFILTIDTNVVNQPVYSKSGNSFVIGRVDNIFDRIVPFVGSYMQNSVNPSADRFQIDIRNQSNNLKDFTFGLMFEKTRFAATNVYVSSEFTSIDPSGVSYIESETHTVYTGMAKLVIFIKTEDVESDRANYVIVREFPEKIDFTEDSSYTIIVNYTAIDSDGVTTLLDTYGQTYDNKFIGQVTLLVDSIPRFSQSFISTISDDYNYFDIGFGIPYGGYYIADKMSPSKLGVYDNVETTLLFTNIEITSPTFVPNVDIISLSDGIRDMTDFRVRSTVPRNPGGGAEYISGDGEPTLLNLNGTTVTKYNLRVVKVDSSGYDQTFNVIDFDKVSINFDTYVRADRIIVRDGDENVLYDSGFDIYRSFDGTALNFDVDVTSLNTIRVIVQLGPDPLNTSYEFTINFKVNYEVFTQVPITFEGINQSPDISLGICDDVHLAWQSNRDNNWNIFYSSSTNKLSPFRFDTKITDTEGNSLRPSVSVNRNGTRLITWHDDRNGNYDIFVARSTEGYNCDAEKCKKEMVEAFDYNVIECNISIDYLAIVGIYALSLEFYKDAALSDLYTTIEINADNIDRWFIDGTAATISYDSVGVAQGIVFSYGGNVVISYIPDKDDGIFDVVLYIKLVSTEVTG